MCEIVICGIICCLWNLLIRFDLVGWGWIVEVDCVVEVVFLFVVVGLGLVGNIFGKFVCGFIGGFGVVVVGIVFSILDLVLILWGMRVF